MRSGVIALLLGLVSVAACGGGGADMTPIDHAIDVTGRDIRDTEYCFGHTAECGVDTAARVRFKASRLLLCPEASMHITPRPDIHDTTLGHTHGRDFQSWWAEGQILRVRDDRDPGEVFDAEGCGHQGQFVCFHAHVVVRGDGITYDDPQALDCVRNAPWDPAP
jgi:hypothetical protein